MNRARTVVFAAAVVLVSSTVGWARDFCIDDPETTGNPDFIVMQFKPPKPGKCDSFVGLYWPEGTFTRNSVQGVACTPPMGDRVNLTMTLGIAPDLSGAIPFEGSVTSYVAALALPSLQGRITSIDAVGGISTGNAAGYACKSKEFL
jgi:hypothetical protein